MVNFIKIQLPAQLDVICVKLLALFVKSEALRNVKEVRDRDKLSLFLFVI